MGTFLLAGSRLSQVSILGKSGTKLENYSTISGHCYTRIAAGENNKNVTEVASKKLSLQKGVLVEFQKDSGRVILGVTQNREGKRNWCVIDQNAETYVVRPNQINTIVPGAENYDPEDVSRLLSEVETLQDPSLLELAWEEMVSRNEHADIEELALMLYGSKAPEKCYSAYRLLASYPQYFKCKDVGFSAIYEPRPLSQVKELQHQQMQEEKAQKNLLDFAEYVKSVMQLPLEQRPNRKSWDKKAPFKAYLESVRAFALETCKSSEITNTAGRVLEALGFTKTPASAQNLLFQIGYFEVHENLQLLKLDIPINFSDACLAEVETIKANPLFDADKDRRVDLTSLRVYTIDNENPDEIDDGLSAVQLPDGRLKVWIHIADPTRWICWNSKLQKEASLRCSSVYLPTMTVPMLPRDLSGGLMSLRQGQRCSCVTITVTLSENGSVAESNIQSSTIIPTYQLSYEAASELLSFNLEEENGLSLLYQAALLRNKWRLGNGALDSFIPYVKVTVADHQTLNPKIDVTVEDRFSPSVFLVTEMMLLCGEVIAAFGFQKGLTLPYKGQAVNEEAKAGLQSIPEGPAHAVASFRCMYPPEMSFSKPLEHACLGLPGYVQFSSPLRRYSDLLVHYQVKASLRGEDPPIPSKHLEASMAFVNNRTKVLKKLQTESDRYWILEYLRRQPSDRKYDACLLRFERDGSAVVFLSEVGMQNNMDLNNKKKIGDTFHVRVLDSQPRKNILLLKEA